MFIKVKYAIILVLALVLIPIVPAVGTPQEWPFSALPDNTAVYVEMPNPAKTAASLDRFMAQVIGMPIPNLLQTGLMQIMEGKQLTSIDWDRPAALIVLEGDTKSKDAPIIVLLPVVSPKAFINDFKDPVTGESAIEKSRGKMTVKLPSQDKINLGFCGNYAMITDSTTYMNSALAIKGLDKIVSARPGAKVSGDLIVHVPAGRLIRKYNDDIEKGMAQAKMALPMAMKQSKTPQANIDMTIRVMEAYFTMGMDMMKQVEGGCYSVELIGNDVKITSRVTPKKGSPLATFVAANPGVDTLPYTGAIPPDSMVSMSGHVNMDSLKPSLDYLGDKIMPLIMGSDAEGLDKINDTMKQSIKHYNGDMMVSYKFGLKDTGGMMFDVNEAIGVNDPAKAMDFISESMSIMNTPAYTNLMASSGMSIKIDKQGERAADGTEVYKMVFEATGNDPNINKMVNQIYGDGMTLYMKPVGKNIVVSSNEKTFRQIASRVEKGSTASFHPLQDNLPGKKIYMGRLNLVEAIQSIFNTIKSIPGPDGMPNPMANIQIPPVPSGSGILMAMQSKDGDLESCVYLPEKEISGVRAIGMQIFMMIQMQQMQQAPPR
jgi:hypothetical protein